MNISRRQFTRLATGAAALPVASPFAWAQTYPTRPVRIIVGFPAGGVSDIFARLIGQSLSDRLGQPFVIENRPGASGTIAMDAVVRARPDGYTLYLSSSGDAYLASLYPDLRFNYLRDMTQVGSIALTSNIMVVNPTFPANSVSQFIDYARASPGKLNFASAGVGTLQHLCGELFNTLTCIGMTHVSYRGGAAAIADLLGGQVQVMFEFLPSSIEYVRAGKLRALSVTAATRLEFLPDVPPLADFVPGFEAIIWFGLAVPRSTPPEIVEKLNREINGALAEPRLSGRIADFASVAFPQSPADLTKSIAANTEKWVKVIQAANIRL